MKKVIEQRGHVKLIQTKAGNQQTAKFVIEQEFETSASMCWAAAAQTYGQILMTNLVLEGQIVERDLRESLNDGGYSVFEDVDDFGGYPPVFHFVDSKGQLNGSIGRPGFKPDFTLSTLDKVTGGYLLSAVDPNGEIHWAKYDGKTWF